MTPVLYILECSLTYFEQWDFQLYNFNNVHPFKRDTSYNSNLMHTIAYTVNTLHSTYYYYILHALYRCYRCMHIFGMNVAFCIDLMAP